MLRPPAQRQSPDKVKAAQWKGAAVDGLAIARSCARRSASFATWLSGMQNVGERRSIHQPPATASSTVLAPA